MNENKGVVKAFWSLSPTQRLHLMQDLGVEVDMLISEQERYVKAFRQVKELGKMDQLVHAIGEIALYSVC